MSRTRQRPKRGHSPRGNVLELGDTGIFPGPQGGAAPGGSDLSRDYGVPQADIPGGVTHLVNPATAHKKPPGVPKRQADAYKYHGVPPSESGTDYVTPPTEDEDEPRPPSKRRPKYQEGVPVYITQDPDAKRRIRTFVPGGRRTFAANAGDGPIRIADRDPHRQTVYVTNENGTRGNFIMIGTREGLDIAVTLLATGGGVEQVGGLVLPGAPTSPVTIDTQDELYVLNISTAVLGVSWAYLTNIEASGAEPVPS